MWSSAAVTQVQCPAHIHSFTSSRGNRTVAPGQEGSPGAHGRASYQPTHTSFCMTSSTCMKTLPAAPVGCLSRLCCQTTCQNPEPTFNDAASVTIVTGVIFLSLGSDLEEKYLSLFSFHTYHSLACCIGTCHSKQKPMSVSPQKQLAQPQASGRQKCTNPTCRHILLSRYSWETTSEEFDSPGSWRLMRPSRPLL